VTLQISRELYNDGGRRRDECYNSLHYSAMMAGDDATDTTLQITQELYSDSMQKFFLKKIYFLLLA
jgi:hypothetical protein